MSARLSRAQFDEMVEQVLNRLDSKGESLAEAVEAVFGRGNKALVAKVRRALGGK